MGSPKETELPSFVVTRTSSPSFRLQISTGVMGEIPLSRSSSQSTSATGSPTLTRSPSRTKEMKPSPCRETVSIPICTSTSCPSSDRNP